MKRVVLLMLLMGLLVAACAGPASEQGSSQQDPINITVYESPT